MTDSMLEKASAYDKNGLMKHEIDNALGLLKQLGQNILSPKILNR